MILVLLGAPGAGKGTQGAEIIKTFHIPNISTGDLLREEVKKGSDLGKEAKSYMDSGRLVPDNLIVAMLKSRILQPDCTKGFILDGFPRNASQAETLDAMFREQNRKLDTVVNVSVETEAVVKRLSNRLSCATCKTGYNRISMPSKVEDICDKCGGKLTQRDDDKEETIRNRMKVYEQQTMPLIEYYKKAGLLFETDGNRDVSAVWTDVLAHLRKFGA